MKKAILFDLDGTLWDSSRQVAEAWSEITLARPFPFKITQADFQAVMGLTMDALAKRLFEGKGVLPEEIAPLAKECERHENTYLLAHPGVLFPGMKEGLEELRKRYALYVVSNCQKGYIEAFFESTGLGPLFEGKLSYGDTEKPKGENIRLLMEKEGIEKAFYFGDTAGDEKAAKVGGIPFVYAAYGFGKAESPFASIASFPELVPFAERYFED